jgi:hypothetical protein
VQIVVEADSEDDASEIIHSLLTEEGWEYVVDWGYISLGGRMLNPIEGDLPLADRDPSREPEAER